MSLNFSESKSGSGSYSIPEVEAVDDKRGSTTSGASIKSDRLDELKKYLPKSKPVVSQKLGKILQSKNVTKIRGNIPSSSRLGGRIPGEEENVYKYPDDLRVFGHQVMNCVWRDDRRAKDLHKNIKDRKTIQGQLAENLPERLYIGDHPEDERVFVQDLDPEFLTLVEGRPIVDADQNVQDYMVTVREILRTKLMIGYREDGISLMEANLRTEQKMLHYINHNFQSYVNLFEEFLMRDHDSARTILKQSNLIAADLWKVNQEHTRIKKLLKGMTISLYKSELAWKTCKIHKLFLFNCSPLSWRRNHPLATSEFQGNDDPEKLCSKILSQNDESDLSLTEILEISEKECSIRETEELYFTDPTEMIDLINYMEAQTINNLMYKGELDQPLAVIKENMEKVSIHFDNVIERLHGNVNRLKTAIEWEVGRVRGLKAMIKGLIFNNFKEIVSATEVLNLYCSVEDIYESIIGPNDTDLSCKKMINTVEEYYRKELFYLDRIPPEIVVYLKGTTIKEHKRIIKFAEKASKQIAELNVLCRAMKIACDPPFEKPRYKPLMFRSPMMKEYKPPPPPPKELSQTELDYLNHFTNFCSYTDNPEDYKDTNFAMNKSKKKRLNPDMAKRAMTICIN